ncbi:DUF5994 family protein [Actinomadura sp. DC4]|uniref:DUF5994 family protein n=1 Tax=Actinomadura sp. DC4 TaxID=3055069 RepID=UPI0025B214CC|nr:DUF5994 family protein [Actinomadura sp. DC4]MDN3352000.1 DUF5994 family protein [Actinomadura sp. DC4]
MAPHVTAQIDVVSQPIPLASRLSLDPRLRRLGVVDGGWWPLSRNATVELPGLVSALNARVGVVLRLGLDARDWDEIPQRVTVGGHVVRIGRFADVNHKIIVTRGRQNHIMLLVIPPDAPTAAAKSALALAAGGKNSGRPKRSSPPPASGRGCHRTPATFLRNTPPRTPRTYARRRPNAPYETVAARKAAGSTTAHPPRTCPRDAPADAWSGRPSQRELGRPAAVYGGSGAARSVRGTTIGS